VIIAHSNKVPEFTKDEETVGKTIPKYRARNAEAVKKIRILAILLGFFQGFSSCTPSIIAGGSYVGWGAILKRPKKPRKATRISIFFHNFRVIEGFKIIENQF
jgi:hypothetical protein